MFLVKRYYKQLLLLVGVICIDQFLKFWINANYQPGWHFALIGPFSITYYINTAGPFNLSINSELLLIMSLSALILLGYLCWLKKVSVWSLALILAGGLSNTVDRIIFQATRDYLGLPWGGYWNLADVAILAGLVWLLTTNRYFKNSFTNDRRDTQV